MEPEEFWDTIGEDDEYVSNRYAIKGLNYFANITSTGDYRILQNGELGVNFFYLDLFENYYSSINFL